MSRYVYDGSRSTVRVWKRSESGKCVFARYESTSKKIRGEFSQVNFRVEK